MGVLSFAEVLCITVSLGAGGLASEPHALLGEDVISSV